MTTENEREFAWHLANKILDSSSADPDGDIAVLARQLVRTRETLDRITGDMPEVESTRHARIDYTNWRGERRVRTISPFFWVHTAKLPWHPKPGWLVFARDLDEEAKNGGKLTPKWFALSGIHSWEDL